MAYQLSPKQGGQTYSMLELVLSLGIFVGSLAVSRFSAIGTMRTVGAGLFRTRVFSVGIWMSSSLPLNNVLVWIGVALFVASIGNPVYAVANQTAIIESADSSNRGSVMATRFGLVQTATIIGPAAGGLFTTAYVAFALYCALALEV